MDAYVVDSSAAIEYLLRTPAGLVLGDTIAGRSLAAPEMFDAEIVSTMRRFVAHGVIPAARAETLLDNLAAFPIERVSHRFLTRTAWHYRHSVTAYDAMYVAVAVAKRAPLITVDGRLARVPNLGIAIHHVQQS
ncbi:type II toxin-antitoxin system VapC family toxin [Candidatus Poriferisodalis sp.]|uniref:type II toxin-antitoxin system VapC family toxin n=1 Tax=Candidatus Poriferisodalis sp. TaxID=3101277 RepID=UPI003AF8A78F